MTRKYSLTKRIVYLWNSLPHAVVSLSTVDQFNKYLDRPGVKVEELARIYVALIHSIDYQPD